MKLANRIVLVLLLSVALVGCKLDLPSPTSGSVHRFEKGAPVSSWQLTERQLFALSSWFKEHQSGWSRSYVTYVPKIDVRVVHGGGKQSSINIWSQKVIVVTGEDQLVQDFELSDIQSLLSAVGL
ncbi:MAG: hypothetical protein ACK4FF_09280 [Limnobacter sp.]|uniref:hypothetical protein n=1 Tax=Limnobacter sp. TaxID=2003368 RepID=UPI00391932BA